MHGDGNASCKSLDMDVMDTETKGIAILDGNVSILRKPWLLELHAAPVSSTLMLHPNSLLTGQ